MKTFLHPKAGVSMTLIISKDGEPTKTVPRSSIPDEKFLQKHIHKNPELIPIYEIKEDRKLLVVAREWPTESGPIDALAVDADGDIYIVETKLFKNPDKRLVIAQALDYGASLWRHSRNSGLLIQNMDEEVNKKFNMSLQAKVQEFFELEDDGYEIFLEALTDNFDRGVLRFIVMMDHLDDRLKDLIQYLNQNSNFNIYAVEVDHYQFNGYDIMHPRLFGHDIPKAPISTGRTKKWDRPSFETQAREKLGDRFNDIIELLNFSEKECQSVSWGTGVVNGSFTPVMQYDKQLISPLSFYSDGHVWVKFGWTAENPEKEMIYKKILPVFMEHLTDSARARHTEDEFLKKNSMVTLTGSDFRDGYKSMIAFYSMLGKRGH